jgi:hypothetical protein
LPLGADDGKQIQDFSFSESPKNIEKFQQFLTPPGKERYYIASQTTLEIKLSENADLIADKLSNQTNALTKLTLDRGKG